MTPSLFAPGSDVLGSQLGPGHCQPVIDSDWKIGFGFVVANCRVGCGTGSRFDDEFVSTLPDTSLSSIIPAGAGVIDMTRVTGDSIRLHSKFVSFILEMFHRDASSSSRVKNRSTLTLFNFIQLDMIAR